MAQRFSPHTHVTCRPPIDARGNGGIGREKEGVRAPRLGIAPHPFSRASARWRPHPFSFLGLIWTAVI
jgi:hypothetical protein